MKPKADAEDSKPAIPTAAELQAEQARLAKMNAICDLFGNDAQTLQADFDLAASELDREQRVRERCFPNWIEQGKLSRIDARDRFTRMKKAQEIINFLLDIAGAPVRMTTDEVPF